jgi:hypothetical protein
MLTYGKSLLMKNLDVEIGTYDPKTIQETLRTDDGL